MWKYSDYCLNYQPSEIGQSTHQSTNISWTLCIRLSCKYSGDIAVKKIYFLILWEQIHSSLFIFLNDWTKAQTEVLLGINILWFWDRTWIKIAWCFYFFAKCNLCACFCYMKGLYVENSCFCYMKGICTEKGREWTSRLVSLCSQPTAAIPSCSHTFSPQGTFYWNVD